MFPLTIRAKRSRRSGFVLVTMALASVGTLAVVGLAVDVGRLYVIRNELQSYTDAAALSAALTLNGTSSGLTAANAALTAMSNKWDFATASVATGTLVFGKAVTGPWDAAPASGAGYTFTKVTARVAAPIYFLTVLAGQKTQNVSAGSTAAQISRSSFQSGLGPFTAVSTQPAGANFGFTVGQQYAIQWPAFNGTRAHCGAANPDACFVSNPCAGDSQASRAAVVQYWSASTDGYWGSNANSTIEAEVLDLIQLQPVAIGSLLNMSSGNKAAEGAALDHRVHQDGDLTDNTVPAYVANSRHNGRRLIPVPIVQPTSSGTYAIGYGAFLLMSDGRSTFYTRQNGNQPFCAVYAGSYVIGSADPGAASSTGAYRVGLVE